MININFKKCCETCENRQSELNEDTCRMYADLEKETITETTVRCIHDKVCKRYLEERQEHEV